MHAFPLNDIMLQPTSHATESCKLKKMLLSVSHLSRTQDVKTIFWVFAVSPDLFPNLLTYCHTYIWLEIGAIIWNR